MGKRYQRLGIRLGRGWVALAVVFAVVAAAAFWVGPMKPWPAEFELVLAAGESGDAEAVELPLEMERGEPRFPLVLQVRNVGQEAGAPVRLTLNVPPHYEVVARRTPVRTTVTPGVPLRRYAVSLPARLLPPDSVPRPLAGLDTIWLRPSIPQYTCVLRTGFVPEFLPAPDLPAEALSEVRIFYSVTGADAEDRGSGLLTLRTDPAVLQANPAPTPTVFPTTYPPEDQRVPDLGQLRSVGTRRAHCGDTELPVALYTVIWSGNDGARVYGIFVEGVERKRLYDTNNDGVVDFETWDSDADGSFEARRQARYAVPEFLQPPPANNPQLLRPDSLPPDSSFVRTFAAATNGPWRFIELARQDSARAVADSLRMVAESMAAVGDSIRRQADAWARAADPPPPAAPEFLQLFSDVGAGPFRFVRPVTRAAPSEAADGDSISPDTGAMQPASDTVGAATNPDTAGRTGAGATPIRQPTPRVPPPLGTPIPPR